MPQMPGNCPLKVIYTALSPTVDSIAHNHLSMNHLLLMVKGSFGYVKHTDFGLSGNL